MSSKELREGRVELPTQVAPAAERKASITEAASHADGATHLVPSLDGYLDVPLVDVPAALLVYRLDNGRILWELAEAAQRRKVDVELFRREPESLESQRLLHGLLLDKARDPAAPIYEELARFGRQTEPLIVGRDGVVVNGNRRLAAMRDLALRDGRRFGHFQTVRAALLPDDATREQLEVIEAALQMAPNLKLEYGWVNRRLKLRQHARDLSRQRILEAYRFPKPEALDVELGELALAEAYLEWLAEPGHYALVEQQGSHVSKLYEQLQLLTQPHLRSTWKLLGFAMIRAGRALDVKIEHYFPFTAPVPVAIRHWVPRTLAEDRGLAGRQETGENRPFDKGLAARLRPLIEDRDRAESTASAVVSLIDALKGNERGLVGFDQVTTHLRKARETLDQLEIEALSPAQLRKLRSQIAALREQVDSSSQPGFAGGTARTRSNIQELLGGAWRDVKRKLRR